MDEKRRGLFGHKALCATVVLGLAILERISQVNGKRISIPQLHVHVTVLLTSEVPVISLCIGILKLKIIIVSLSPRE